MQQCQLLVKLAKLTLLNQDTEHRAIEFAGKAAKMAEVLYGSEHFFFRDIVFPILWNAQSAAKST